MKDEGTTTPETTPKSVDKNKSLVELFKEFPLDFDMVIHEEQFFKNMEPRKSNLLDTQSSENKLKYWYGQDFKKPNLPDTQSPENKLKYWYGKDLKKS